MTLQQHRPDGRGGLDSTRVPDRNWRSRLRSPRWGASLGRGQVPELKNPEMNPTPTWMAVAFWLGLAAVTFVVLVLGYGTGFWR